MLGHNTQFYFTISNYITLPITWRCVKVSKSRPINYSFNNDFQIIRVIVIGSSFSQHDTIQLYNACNVDRHMTISYSWYQTLQSTVWWGVRMRCFILLLQWLQSTSTGIITWHLIWTVAPIWISALYSVVVTEIYTDQCSMPVCSIRRWNASWPNTTISI